MADGTSTHPNPDGTSTHPNPDGTSTHPTPDGTSCQPTPDGTSCQPTPDGTSTQPTPTASAHQPTPTPTPTPTLTPTPTPTPTPTTNETLPSSNAGTETDSTSEVGTGRLKSIVWQHFEKVKVDGEDKAKCNYCKKLLGGKSKNGTKHLHGHMDSCLQRRIMMKGQQVLMPKVTKGKQEVVATSYDGEVSKKELAKAIILHEYPLSIVDHIGFRRYSNSLQPVFKVPSRNTIKKEILKIYKSERSMAVKMINSNEGRVAITTDMWTAGNQKRGYMAITAHFIDAAWNLRSCILRFIYVPAPHTSERLGHILASCLMDCNIDTKLSTITLDNCSTNDSMVHKVKDRLPIRSLWMDGSLIHMRCCAHILNLIVKDGLDVVKDGIEKVRDSVAYWTQTPKRKEKFDETANQLKVGLTKALCLDCPTRWNSTYKMLEVAIAYKEVFSRLRYRDHQYTCFPSNQQWEFANEVCGKLEVFNTVTEMISGTKYPTANAYFPEICEIKLAISEWLNSPNEVIRKMAKKMFDKFENYWSVTHDIMGIATVLDPRYKMELLEFYYEQLYEGDSAAQVERIRQLSYDFVSDYQLQLQLSRESSSTSQTQLSEDTSGSKRKSMSRFDMFVSRKQRARPSLVKTELDHYLEEGVLPRSNDFDILLWWKLNGVKYPTLQVIARDVLAIPISTVASESAFSTSGQILSPHRSRLHWTTLEALMCARSWLWSEENIGSIGLISPETQDVAMDEAESDTEDVDDLMASCVTYHLEDI